MPLVALIVLLPLVEWLDDHRFLICGICVGVIALVIVLWIMGVRSERKRP